MSSEFNKVVVSDRNDPASVNYVEPEEFEHVKVGGMKHGCKLRDGVFLPNFVRNLSQVKRMQLKDDDIFVIGCMKSGTSWVEEIVWLLKNNLDYEAAKSKFHFSRVAFIDSGCSEKRAESLPSPRIFKTHLPLKFLPDDIEKKIKAIYVLRNPKDLVVSQYHFVHSGLLTEQFEGSFEQFFDLFVSGNSIYGPFWDHVNEFTERSGFHIVCYEDLLKDPIEEIRKMAAFLNIEIDDAQLKMLVEQVSFTSMKKNTDVAFNLESIDQFFLKTVKYFRKGQVGDWKNHLTHEMSERLEQIVREKITYPKLYKYELQVEDKTEYV